MHRLESVSGSDARVFRPDRWEDGELVRKVGLGAGFLDFHGGPRVCLGSKLALYVLPSHPFSLWPDRMLMSWGAEDYAIMEGSYAAVRFLQTYLNIRLPPEVPNEHVGVERQNLTIVLSSAEGAKVLPK